MLRPYDAMFNIKVNIKKTKTVLPKNAIVLYRINLKYKFVYSYTLIDLFNI